jgi:hypothetical protein
MFVARIYYSMRVLLPAKSGAQIDEGGESMRDPALVEEDIDPRIQEEAY